MPVTHVTLTKQDFDQYDWQNVIVNCDEKECSAYMSRFFDKASEADTAGDKKAHAIFSLLGAVTSLMLKRDTREEPFGPMAIFNDSRSAIVDDFDDTELDVLKALTPEINDPELRARVADILWLRKRDFRMVGIAVDAYLESANILEHPEQWPACMDRIQRAINLAASLGKNRQHFDKVIAHVEAMLDKYAGEDPLFLSAKLMGLLQIYRQGDPIKYAALAAKAASLAEDAHDWHRARTYWQVEARWHVLAKDAVSERAAKQREAETYVFEAEDVLRQMPPNFSIASVHLQQAIETYRRLGNAQERIQELHKNLIDYQKQSVNEMHTFSAEMDLTKFAEYAQELVKGKSIYEALLALAQSSPSPNTSKVRERVQRLGKEFPMQYLLSAVLLNEEGKVVARRPSMLSSDPEDIEAATRAEMFKQAMLEQQFHVFGLVEPARQQINLEHNYSAEDLLPLVTNNPFVPMGREMLYARGLYAGLIGDFPVAAHLLIPQIEHSLRYVLQHQGVLTSSLDPQGIQDERNLNTTLYLPETVELFGEDLVFDLQGLLVERFGSNLRNRMAHGLLDHAVFYAPQVAYLWWLTLRICCLPFLAQMRQAQSKTDQSKPVDVNE